MDEQQKPAAWPHVDVVAARGSEGARRDTVMGIAGAAAVIGVILTITSGQPAVLLLSTFALMVLAYAYLQNG